MCFARLRRALFRHLNFQKWSGRGAFCTFSLGNVLRATTACTFSTSQLPKVVRAWCALYILTWTCVSRHNGVQFFISHLASWLRTRRFSEPTFRPSGAPNHWKNTVFRDFPTFSRICIFFLLTLSLLLFFLRIFLFSLPLPCSAFHLSIMSEVWLLNFLRLCSVNIQPFPSQHAPCGIQILRQHLLCLLPSKALYESALRLPGPSFQKMIPGSVGSAALYLTTASHAQFIPFFTWHVTGCSCTAARTQRSAVVTAMRHKCPAATVFCVGQVYLLLGLRGSTLQWAR